MDRRTVRRSNILIVDDEPNILKGLKLKIMRCNISDVDHIYTALTVDEALVIMKNKNVDMIITDIEMPGKTGLEMLRRINEINAAILKIVISGHDDFKYVKNAFIEGVIDYLLKPVSIDVLRNTLQTGLDELEKINKAKLMEKISRFNEIGGKIHDRMMAQSSNELSQVSISAILRDTKVVPVLPFFKIVTICFETDKKIKKLIYDVHEKLENRAINVFHSFSRKRLLHIFINDNEINTLESATEQILASCRACSHELYIFATESLSVRELSSKVIFQIRQLLVEKMILPRNKINRYTEQSEKHTADYSVDLYVSKLEFAVEMSDIQRFNALIDDIFSIDNLTEHGMRVCKNLYDKIINLLRYQSNAVTREQNEKDFLEFNTIEELAGFLKDSFSLLLKDSNTTSKIVSFTDEYIGRNMDKKINMASVANHFNMNYSGFSRLFAGETGVNFSNYVILKKLNYAKSLIERTNKTVNEIASDVGYINPKNFTRVFKQVFGHPPSHFMKHK